MFEVLQSPNKSNNTSETQKVLWVEFILRLALCLPQTVSRLQIVITVSNSSYCTEVILCGRKKCLYNMHYSVTNIWSQILHFIETSSAL
jgi:hypothetical protein